MLGYCRAIITQRSQTAAGLQCHATLPCRLARRAHNSAARSPPSARRQKLFSMHVNKNYIKGIILETYRHLSVLLCPAPGNDWT